MNPSLHFLLYMLAKLLESLGIDEAGQDLAVGAHHEDGIEQLLRLGLPGQVVGIGTRAQFDQLTQRVGSRPRVAVAQGTSPEPRQPALKILIWIQPLMPGVTNEPAC